MFSSKTVTQLKMYLKDRGVTFTGYIRRELITLCECVANLNLPVLHDVSDVSCASQTLSHLNINSDPFLIPGYSNNLSQSPEIGIYDVFNYLVSFRPDYDRRKLRAYKSFQDYRLYADGHVNSVEYVDATDTVGIFKASVKPTQRDKTYLKSEFYNLWIAVDKMNVDIKTAYCQCPGGSDGACRHIAATLFDIEAFEKKSITDGPSLWTKRPRPHDEPVPLAHLKVKKISYIEHETTGQSENPTWSVMRKGMVTSSNFKRVCTRADAFEKNKNIDCSKLVKCLLHDSLSTDISNVPSAIVWGKKRESKAKEMYTQIERRHTKLSVKIKGLLIDKENPFLGTSVDAYQ
ncbi:uncharacterized protein [Haliotis asinina]|uniref:uncharacterized protein n=1 Tax=Haliotis asinina TaxID=109174 RepID=UPI003531C88B